MAGATIHNPFTGKIVGGAIPTLYKDCVEKHGYVKTGTDYVSLTQDHPEYLTDPWTNPWRLEGDRCGAPNQTCFWWMGQGRWTVAPLPR
jgi:hypothetical protein